MRLRLFFLPLFLFFSVGLIAQDITICSWNLKDFGKAKSEQSLDFISRTIEPFDVIAVQEVVAGVGGVSAVEKLVSKLNQNGEHWSYEVSAITSGINTNERYAFIWKSNKVKKIGTSWLDKAYELSIEREPYLGRFKVGEKNFTIVSFHALPKTKHPETEIKYLKFFPNVYTKDNLIFCGDFNLPQSHSVFVPLKKLNYIAALVKQKTSLKQQCINDDCLASEYDNFYYNKYKINALETGILHFYKLFDDLKAARKISDHVPIYLKFSIY